MKHPKTHVKYRNHLIRMYFTASIIIIIIVIRQSKRMNNNFPIQSNIERCIHHKYVDVIQYSTGGTGSGTILIGGKSTLQKWVGREDEKVQRGVVPIDFIKIPSTIDYFFRQVPTGNRSTGGQRVQSGTAASFQTPTSIYVTFIYVFFLFGEQSWKSGEGKQKKNICAGQIFEMQISSSNF